MKKLVLAIILGTFLCTYNIQAQTEQVAIDSYSQNGLNIGGGIFFPMYNASEVSSFGFYLDVNYLFEVGNGVTLGLASGFAQAFGKEERLPLITIDHDDFQYIPIAFAARYTLPSRIVFGGDIGYAIGVSDNWDGGFYYRPMFGFNLNEKLQVNTSFTGISDSWFEWNTWNIGFMYNL